MQSFAHLAVIYIKVHLKSNNYEEEIIINDEPGALV